MVPLLAFRPSPAGSEPADTDQVSGAVPPVEVTPLEYRAPTVPPESDVVVIESVEATEIESDLVAVAPTPSSACTVKLGAVAVGVPLITPAELRLSPAGRAPDETDQVGVPVPPVDARVVE